MPPIESLSPGWTPERVETLERLWRDGRSASQVAILLGVTRNAVIGKVHRLGLSATTAHAKPPARPKRRRAGRPSSAPSSRCPAAPVASLSPACARLLGLVTRLETLPTHACRWPIGDPQDDGFAWCGRAAPVQPYCPAHRQLAYRGRR